jgi:predicted dinucleotide-binding enzyme
LPNKLYLNTDVNPGLHKNIKPMQIAIIGTGNIGSTLARKWSAAGHHIFLGVRDTNNFKGKELLSEKNISVHSISQAVEKAEVILIAVVPQATHDIVKAMGDVSGKIIIDTMNSLRTKPEGYNDTFEALKDLCKNAAVIKCFNSTGFENIQNPVYPLPGDAPHQVAIDMFVAGSDAKGKQAAIQLSLDAGFAHCYDFGGDDKVALLEQFAFCWINLAIMQGQGRNMAFKLIKR